MAIILCGAQRTKGEKKRRHQDSKQRMQRASHGCFNNNEDVAMVGTLISARQITEEKIKEIKADVPLSVLDVPMLVSQFED